MQCGLFEKRAEQELVFRTQGCALSKKEIVDILREGLAFVKHVDVIRYASENHVCLGDLIACPNDASMLELLFHFI